VLKSGGRLAISDIVATAELPEALKNDMTVFTGCMAGASSITDIEKMLKHDGFINIEIKPKNNSKKFIQNWIPNSNIEDYVVSATIEAIKP
jgi:arsenite methyltransferase